MHYDVAVIGAGIVGLSTAYALLERRPGLSLVVLESCARVAAHQSGLNSGVIHSGIYYKPGSLKASLCVRGRAMLIEFCKRHDLPIELCGKLIVAMSPEQISILDELQRRGAANGLEGLELLNEGALRKHEPCAGGVAALYVPQTGITDFARIAQVLSEEIQRMGAAVHLSTRFLRARVQTGALALETSNGPVTTSRLINCGGLYSDRVARACGIDPRMRIVPFRGEYLEVVPDRCHLVRGLIYPAPDLRLPFLGPHFTRTIDGGVIAGPNAVLALKREGYRKADLSLSDVADMLAFPGFWRMGLRHWRVGAGEMWRSLNRSAFIRSVRPLVPEIKAADLRRGFAGVRAQAVDGNGNLLDDFHIREGEHTLQVLNAPSPAATSSLAIGQYIADRAEETLLSS